MNTKFKKLSLICSALFSLNLGGCSDAKQAALGNLGDPAKVLVYSGGKLIYEGVSTGKIENESGSDGYYFNDKCIDGPNKLAEVSGDVIITRKDLSCPKKTESAPRAAP